MKDPIKAITGRLLTSRLMELATEIAEVTDTGDNCSRVDKLAQEVWKAANGYIETINVKGKAGVFKSVEIKHNPQPWAIHLLFDRFEGKISSISEDKLNRPSLGHRITESGTERINNLSSSKRTVPGSTNNMD
jgi:hypothetical protein